MINNKLWDENRQKMISFTEFYRMERKQRTIKNNLKQAA